MSGTVPATITVTAIGREHQIATGTLPQSSLDALLRRGLQHFLGNEQAAKVSGAKAKRAEEVASRAKLIAANDPAAVTAGPLAPHTEAELSDLANGFIQAALATMTEGTMGQGRGPAAPKVDPLTAAMNAIALRHVRVLMKANDLTANKQGEVKFANGTTLTLADMTARRLASPEHGPAIRKEAEKELASRDREAKALGKVAAEAQDVLSLLG